MDIQFAYNLERMLFYVCRQDGQKVASIMEGLERQFQFQADATGVQLPEDVLHEVQEIFQSISVSDEDTINTIRAIYEEHGVELCPHSAIGVYAGLHLPSVAGLTQVCVLTAHPAKFESSIVKALGTPPAMPAAIQALSDLPQRFECLDKSSDNWRQQWITTIKNDVQRYSSQA